MSLMPSLSLYTPVTGTSKFAQNITDIAINWRHKSRWQGGYWDAGFTIEGDRALLDRWLYNRGMYHLVERWGDRVTWEGFIAEMDPHFAGGYMDISLLGYIHTCQARHVSVADDAVGNVSAWIADILTTDCPLIGTQHITTNTLQVQRSLDSDRRGWDEICRAVALGDASGNPWRIHVGNNREIFYLQCDPTPLYYTTQGVDRRWSWLEMYNYISGIYTDAAGADQTLAVASNANSISKYGRREYKMQVSRMPQAAVEARRDAFLKENAWPVARVLGNTEDIDLRTTAGVDLVKNGPWLIKPGVVRDLSYPVTGQLASAWLTDRRDFLVEEVEVSQDGVFISTVNFTEEGELIRVGRYLEPTEATTPVQAPDNGSDDDRPEPTKSDTPKKPKQTPKKDYPVPKRKAPVPY